MVASSIDEATIRSALLAPIGRERDHFELLVDQLGKEYLLDRGIALLCDSK